MADNLAGYLSLNVIKAKLEGSIAQASVHVSVDGKQQQPSQKPKDVARAIQRNKKPTSAPRWDLFFEIALSTLDDTLSLSMRGNDASSARVGI